MATLNQVVCQSVLRNTGYGSCVLDIGRMKGAFRVPKGKIFLEGELANLQVALTEGTLAASKSQRIFPLHGFETATDNSEDTVYQTMGYGKQVPVRDGNYRWTFQYLDGGMCLSMALRSFNFQASDWLFYDDKFQLFGWRKSENGVNYGIAGVPLTFHANKFKVHDGANVTQYTVYFDIDSYYLNDALGFVKADFPLSDIVGLQNIVLRQTGVSVAGVSQIQALTSCDYSNLYDLYSTQLASASLWTATNAVTGNAITITSVAANPNSQAFTITLSTSDTDYPATASGQVIINLVNPTLLDQANVTGFEGIPVTIIRG